MAENRYSTRLRLRDDELDVVENYRRLKEEAKKQGIPVNEIKHGWVKSKNSSLFFKNPRFQSIEKDAFVNSLLKDLKQYSPKFPKVKRTKSKESYCLVLDPADIHVGKLCTAFETGTQYNQQIAVKRVLDGVKGILNKSQGFHIDKIIFIGGNDILHTDTPQKNNKWNTTRY